MPITNGSPRFVTTGTSAVVSGAAIQAAEWESMCAAHDALAASGSVLIPWHAPMTSISASGSKAYTYRVWPKYAATHRLWSMAFISSTSTPATASIALSDGTTVGALFTDAAPRTISFVHQLSSRSAAEASETVTITLGSTSAAKVVGMGCWEYPRPAIALPTGSLPFDATTTDMGMDQAVARALLPIADDYAGLGVGYMAHAVDSLRDETRRTGIFAAAPFASSTSSTFAAVFQAPPIALGRFLYRGQTSALMQLAAYVRTSDSSTSGEVRFTMASGASLTLGFSGVTSTTLIRGQIAIDAEDLTTSDGRRASRSDTCLVKLRRSAGAGTAYLDTLSAGEGAAGASTTVSPALGIGAPGSKKPLGKLPPRWMPIRRKSR